MNHKINETNLVNMSLKAYVNQLDNSQKTERRRFRERLADLIVCSPVTIVQKIRDNRWTAKEKLIIAEFMGESVETLFPANHD
jgi:hypothetical protein